MDWQVTLELKRTDLDGEEVVERYTETFYESKNRWKCRVCGRLNFIQPDADDPSFDPHVCEGCGLRQKSLPADIDDDAWWIVCSKCDIAIQAADFGQHLLIRHIHIPEESDTVGSQYI